VQRWSSEPSKRKLFVRGLPTANIKKIADANRWIGVPTSGGV
ncbi:hypothetical protein AVEN_122378-1, partial [Araneus ventricosus]